MGVQLSCGVEFWGARSRWDGRGEYVALGQRSGQLTCGSG